MLIRTIVVGLLLVGVAVACSQEQSLEEWEKMSEHGVSSDRMSKEAEEAGYELVRTDTFLPEDLIFVLRPKP